MNIMKLKKKKIVRFLDCEVRCPSCASLHDDDKFGGILNNMEVYFCKDKCRKYYFSLTLIDSEYGDQ